MTDKTMMAIKIASGVAIVVTTVVKIVMEKKNKEDPQSRILMGLARDRIISQSLHFIDRGWISDDEYGDLNKYLYEPYVELGGNGTAKRLMDEVKKLPIRHITYDQLSKNEVV